VTPDFITIVIIAIIISGSIIISSGGSIGTFRGVRASRDSSFTVLIVIATVAAATITTTTIENELRVRVFGEPGLYRFQIQTRTVLKVVAVSFRRRRRFD
jgi:hypothetical protein